MLVGLRFFLVVALLFFRLHSFHNLFGVGFFSQQGDQLQNGLFLFAVLSGVCQPAVGLAAAVNQQVAVRHRHHIAHGGLKAVGVHTVVHQ